MKSGELFGADSTAASFVGVTANSTLVPVSRWRAAIKAASLTMAAMAASVTFAATTTVSVLIDSDNNVGSGCTISTANGPFAGVDRVLNTLVVADTSGYRITSITLQSCLGSSLGAPSLIDGSSTPLARGNGVNGTTAVETYIPNIFLPAQGQKMRVGITTTGADGLVGTDALTLTSGGPILVDGPPLLVIPTLAKMSLALTALLLALSVWFARRRGWHGLQMVFVAAFALSISGQLIAAIVRDGFIVDWQGVPAAAIDPAGDSPAGTDITNLYSTVENGNVFFRVDTVLNAPPVANAQSVIAVVGQSVPITLTGADYESSPLTFTVVTPPAQGVLAGTAPNLTYTPNANATSSDSFTFTANDGLLDSAPATVSIDIKRPPTITSANSIVFIPGQANSFNFTATAVPVATFTFTACAPALPPSISLTNNGNNTATLSGNPTVAQGGVYSCTVTASNGFGANATQPFTLNLGAPPTITSAPTLLNATEGVAYSHSVTATALASFPITAMSTTGTLPPVLTLGAPVGLGTSAANANFAGTPAVCSRGTYSSFAFTATNSIATTTQNATLTILGRDVAPSFTVGATQTVNEDVTAQTVNGFLSAISVGPSCESAQTVSFAVTNTNATAALFAVAPSISPTGVLTYTPALNANGTATFSVVATDTGSTANGGANVSAAQNFSIVITAVNDVPSFTKGADVTVLEDAGAQTIAGWATAISAGPTDEAGQTLTFNVTGNTNVGLFSVAPAVASNGTLTFTPAANANGSATITLTLGDNGGTANGGVDTSPPQTFVINVTAVNDAPSFTVGPNQTVLEDSGPQTVNPWATAISPGPANEAGQTITFLITGNTNPGLFAAGPAVSSTGVLTYTPTANANGVATVTLRVQDNGLTANGGIDVSPTQSFTITVTAVNDAPSFVSGGNVSIGKSAAPVAYNQAWATAISAGPADEVGQVLTFNITGNTNNALFSVQPAISSTGVLSFTPVANAFGSATITTRLQDNGGTLNGGIDLSAQQTFTIEVTSPPVYTSLDTAVFPLNLLSSFNITTLSQPGVTSIALTDATNTGPCVLPTGVTFSYVSGNNASLSGTATTSTPVDCTVTAINTAGTTTQLLHVIPGTPPTAEDDALIVLNGGTLTANIYVANPTLPDDPGVPNSAVTSVGGGSLGGVVTTNVVPAGPTGLSVPLAGGTLTIKQDGSLTLATPNVNGTYSFMYRLTNAVGTEDAVVTIIVGTVPAITGSFTPTTIVGAAYSSTVTVTGSPTPTTSVTGTLPPGITLAGSTLSGTATTPGTYPTTFVAANVFLPNASVSSTITVSCDTITVNPVAAATLGSPFVLNTAMTPANFSAVSSTSNPGSYNFTVSSGALPAGLSLSLAGALTGTPTVGGPSTFDVTATHTTTGCLGTRSYTVAVQRVVTAVNDSASGTIPTPVSAVTVNTPNLIANDLPAGFPAGAIASFGGGSLAGNAGTNAAASSVALAGGTLTVNADGTWSLVNPITAGVYTFLYRLTNSVPSSSDATVTVTLSKAPTINSAASANFTIGQSGSFNITTANTHPVAAITRTGTLVSGLNFVDNGNGTATISGTAAAGTTSANVQAITANNAVAPNATQNLTLNVACPAITVNPASGALPSVIIGAGLNNTFTNTGGNGGVNFSSTGTLPTGGTLSTGGVLTGTTTATGNFGFSVVATDGFACTGTTAYTLRVCPVITTAPIGVPTHLRNYSHLLVASGGTGPYTYATGGTLPTGITLGGATLSGSNIGATGAYSFTVTATDANGCAGTTTMSGTVNEPPVAVADSYEYVGNTQLEVNAAPSITTPKIAVISATGVLSNDTDAGGGTLVVSGVVSCAVVVAPFGPCATANGGSVTVNANGTFTFTPLAGDTNASDSFQYIVSDGFVTSTGTVTLNRVGRVVYVKNNAAVGGSGRSHEPFNTLGAAGGVGSAAGDYIFVYGGDLTTTGQAAGITLKANQKLYGEANGLTFVASVNGVANTVLVAANAGNRPKVDNTAGDAVSMTNIAGVEVRGLSIAASGNAVILTTTGAATGGVTATNNLITAAGLRGVRVAAGGSGGTAVTIQNNTVTSTGNSIDVATTAGATVLDISSNTATATASGIVIDGSGGGTTTITGFANNAVGGNTGGSGIVVTSATFDATPGGTFQTVSGGATVVGASGNGVGASGMVLTNASGDLSFTDLDIFADGGAGLRASGTTPYTGSAGLRLAVGAGVGTVAAIGGPAVDLNNVTANTLTFTQVSSTNSPTTGVALNGLLGGFSAGAGSSITGSTGTGFQVGSSNATISYGGTITTTIGKGVDLANNTGSTISFTGAITSTSGANVAFNATGGGTVSATDTTSTLTTTSGTALNVANTTIGASGLRFRSISANGGANGIVLNTTGAGGLTVTGTGTTAGSGGTIQNTTTRGASFISASNISLSNMNFTNAATNDFPAGPTGLSLGVNTADNAAIHLQTVTNVTLDRLNINGSAEHGINGHHVMNFALRNSTITNAGNGPDEDGIHFFNMLGTSEITNTTITSSGDDNINIQNNTPGAHCLPATCPPLPAGMTAILNLTITGGSANTGVQGSGYLMGIRGTSNATVTIDGVTANNNFSGGIVIDTYDTATSSIEIMNSTSTNNNDGISMSSNNGNTKFDIHNNVSFAGNDFARISILKAAFSTGGTLQGNIRNNPVVVTDGQAADGIIVAQRGDGILTVGITNNTITYRGTQRAIAIQGGQDGSGQLNATVTGNTIDMQLDGTGNAATGILAQVAIASPSGDNTNMCADIGGAGALRNVFTHSLGNNMPAGDIRVRQRFATTVTLPGYAGANNGEADVVTYLASRNTLVNSPTATATNGIVAGDPGAGGYLGGGACPQPVFP